MSAAAQLKTSRTSAKRAVTKQANQIRQCIVEDNLSVIDEYVAKLKHLFSTFSSVHNDYQALFTDDDDIEAGDIYFYKVQDKYISVLESAKSLFKGIKVDVDQKDSASFQSSSFGNLSPVQFLGLFNLPKVELQIFEGNPLHYHQFRRSFDVNVDKTCEDSDLKLARLMQYTGGQAKEAIRGC